MQDREKAHQVQIMHKKCSQEKARNAVKSAFAPFKLSTKFDL